VCVQVPCVYLLYTASAVTVQNTNIFGSQMGFFQAEVKNCLKITNFVDLIVNIVDGHRLQLLILLRRVGNGLFKSV
jgi:hypothetical protein